MRNKVPSCQGRSPQRMKVAAKPATMLGGVAAALEASTEHPMTSKTFTSANE